jgi:hypothetical protein
VFVVKSDVKEGIVTIPDGDLIHKKLFGKRCEGGVQIGVGN